jgi:glycosyltransferase involved in cell wall biosynthesis
MHILVLYRGGGTGGDATVSFSLWDEWLKAGHSVSGYVVGGIYKERAESLGKQVAKLESWTEIPAEEVRRADAVNLHLASEYPTWTTDVGPLSRVFGPQRLFCTAHGPKPLRDVVRPLRKRIGAIRAARKLNRIVVPSKHKTREWGSVLPMVRNVQRIHNPVHEPGAWDKRAARAEMGLPEDRFIGAFVGLMRPEKGLMTILKAMRSLHRTDLMLIAAGSGPEEERARTYAQEHGLQVRFCGYMIDPSPVYRAADFFLFPSSFDNFPIALLQAAACDLPIIASDIEVVRDEFASCPAVRTFKPGEVEGLSAQVLCLLEELPLLEVGLADVVRRDCAPAQVASRYIDLFNELGQAG